jgi:hypothetical protein
VAAKTLSELLMSETLLPPQHQGQEYGVRMGLPRTPESNQAFQQEVMGGVMPERGKPFLERFGNTPGGNVEMAAQLIGGPALGKVVGGGIRAFHGSPHKFDKFSMDRIGTGEGAQAYGHGLYFAENEGVAKSYRDQLSGRAGNTQTPMGAADRAVGLYGDGAIDALKREIASMQTAAQRLREAGKGVPQVFLDRIKNEYEPAIELVRGGYKPGGHMYEVNIRANPEQFLDWDRPLGQQPLAGARALNPLVERLLQDPHASQHMTPGGPSDQILGHIHDAARAGRNPVSSLQLSPNAVENTLREAGIPGIKYLDQGSRMHPATLPDTPMANEARQFLDAAKGDHNVALQLFRDSNPVNRYATTERDEIQQILKNAANQPTSNYVVFDDSIIDILKRYGLMGGAAAGPLSQLMQTEE